MANVLATLFEMIRTICRLLSGLLRRSGESKEDIQRTKELMESFEYEEFNDKCSYDVYPEIPEEDLKSFVDGLRQKHQLLEKTATSLLDILGSERQLRECYNFTFNEGKGSLRYEQSIAKRSDGKVSLEIAQYNLSFEVSKIMEERPKEWFRFNLWNFTGRKSSDEKEKLTMSEEQKNMFIKACQAKLYNHVEECRKQDITQSQ